MEKIYLGDYIGTKLSANDPGKLLSYYHQQYPCSNVLNLLYLKMLEEERPKEYEKAKAMLMLSLRNRGKYHQFQLSNTPSSKHTVAVEQSTETAVEEQAEQPPKTYITPPEAKEEKATATVNPVIEEVRKIVEKNSATSTEKKEETSADNYEIVVNKNFDAPTINLDEDQSTVIDSLIAKFGGEPSTIKKSALIKEPLANYSEGSLDEDEDIVSLTLAIIYAEQGYGGKATKMLKKLSLIFPEKSSIFASHIEMIKNGKYNQIN